MCFAYVQIDKSSVYIYIYIIVDKLIRPCLIFNSKQNHFIFYHTYRVSSSKTIAETIKNLEIYF